MSSPFPYTCELCGAEGLTDEGMRSHTETHIAGRPECPFCDCTVPQTQLLGHVQTNHLRYLTPEREIMAFIDDQSPSYNTPGSMNGWHSPDSSSSSSYQKHNGAISKNYHEHNGYDKNYSNRNEKDNKRDEESVSSSPSNVNLSNGLRNINITNGVIPKKPHRQGSSDADVIKGHDRKGKHSSPSHNNSGSYEGSPDKNKLTMVSAGQGSPLRSQLALKLKPNTPKKSVPSPTVQCLLCEVKSRCPKKLEEHINRAHFDLTSPSVIQNANSNSLGLNTCYTAMALSPGPKNSCPLCDKEFQSGAEVEMHVNVDHRDILSPQKSEALLDNATCEDVVMIEESPVSNCPVCCQQLPLSHHELIQHIEEHFERGEEGAAALSLSDAERQARKTREEEEFQLLRAQYGMEEDEEVYSNRATNSLKRAVYSGALSVAGYYERSVELKRASATGKDAGCSKTSGIIERIISLNAHNQSIYRTYTCSEVDHYASTYGDRGWGCGYRNMQIVISSLMKNPQYARLLSCMVEKEDGVDCVPSIPRLQLMMERAWQLGFDTQGSEQLGCKLHNTKKWIGACEVVTVLSSLRIRCKLIDFHKPSSLDGSHPAMFDWVLRYFSTDPTAFKAPLYLQHQGHSRTIIGYEKHRDGKGTLLVLDPSHSPMQIQQVLCGTTSAGNQALRLLRQGSSAMRAKQYQLVAVQGVSTDGEYEASKVLQSVRIP